jgi:hypothetical protein
MAIMNTALRNAADAYRGRPAPGGASSGGPAQGVDARGVRAPSVPSPGVAEPDVPAQDVAAADVPAPGLPASDASGSSEPVKSVPRGPVRAVPRGPVQPLTAFTAHPSEGWKPEGDWKLYAECGPGDTELFFSKDPMEKKAALAICNDCPVVSECLAEAMTQETGVDLHGRYGIRGGTTPVQRRELARSLNQRPVKPRRNTPTSKAG